MTLESNNGSVIRNDKSKARQVINGEIDYVDEDELFRELVLGLDNEDEQYLRYIESSAKEGECERKLSNG